MPGYRLNLRVTAEEYEWVRHTAKRQNRSMSAVVCEAIDRFLSGESTSRRAGEPSDTELYGRTRSG